MIHDDLVVERHEEGCLVCVCFLSRWCLCGGVHIHVHHFEAVGGVKVGKYELETVRVQMEWVVCCLSGAEHGTCRGECGRIGV